MGSRHASPTYRQVTSSFFLEHTHQKEKQTRKKEKEMEQKICPYRVRVSQNVVSMEVLAIVHHLHIVKLDLITKILRRGYEYKIESGSWFEARVGRLRL
jgi:hypothetical protein